MIIIYKPNINSLPNKDATTLRFTRHVLSLMGEPEGDKRSRSSLYRRRATNIPFFLPKRIQNRVMKGIVL